MKSGAHECAGRILVVEDDRDIRETLAEVLREDGYDVRTAANGREAFTILEQMDETCCVLLDLMMPQMNGWEFVDLVRKDIRWATLPVVVTSAAADRAPAGVDRVLGKPLDLDNIVATVGEFCDGRHTISAVVRELARRNIELAELRRFRDEMSALVVHDLKSPLAVIMSSVQYALAPGALEADRIDALQDSLHATRRALRLIENLLHLSKLETGTFRPARKSKPLTELFEPLLSGYGRQATERGVTLQSDIHWAASCDCDTDQITRVIENILENALRHTPKGGVIRITGSRGPAGAEIRIGNSGPPVPAEARERIFDKFGQAGPGMGRSNLGLGLYFCRLAVEAHGGTIKLDASPELPTIFVIRLP